MKENRDLLKGLTTLNIVLHFTFTEYYYSVQISSSARTREIVGRTHPCTVRSARFIQLVEIRCAPLHLVALRSPFNDHEHVGRLRGMIFIPRMKATPI